MRPRTAARPAYKQQSATLKPHRFAKALEETRLAASLHGTFAEARGKIYISTIPTARRASESAERSHAKIALPEVSPYPMADQNNRQAAEDHYYAALDFVADGNQPNAVQEYEKSLAADPTFTEAMHGMSRALQDLGRLDEAITVAKRISEIDPDDVLAHTSLSVLYQKKGMIPEAEEEGNRARVLGWKQQLKKPKL